MVMFIFFVVDYDTIAVDDILDIHNYLIKRMTQYNKMFGFVKRIFISAMMVLVVVLQV